MTREEKAIAFVEEFVKHGFRIDLMPTRCWVQPPERAGQMNEYQWWAHYVSGAEKRLVDVARDILK